MSASGDAAAQAYDAIAHEYNAHLHADPLARYMRARLRRRYMHLFQPGQHILDLAAGTGLDARFLAAQGLRVTALDISPGMVAELRRANADLAASIEARVLAAERLGELEGEVFDGVISAFAGINTVDNMPRLARDLAEHLRPGACVLLHALSARCLWRRLAGRARCAQVCIGGHSVTHRFYHPLALWREAFAPYFELQRCYALAVIAIPPLLERFPHAAPLLYALDRLLGPLLPASGDFFVLELVRRRAL